MKTTPIKPGKGKKIKKITQADYDLVELEARREFEDPLNIAIGISDGVLSLHVSKINEIIERLNNV